MKQVVIPEEEFSVVKMSYRGTEIEIDVLTAYRQLVDLNEKSFNYEPEQRDQALIDFWKSKGFPAPSAYEANRMVTVIMSMIEEIKKKEDREAGVTESGDSQSSTGSTSDT